MKEEDLASNELRTIVENATEEIFLIDPGLDAEFVWDYFVHANQGVSIRLLTSKQYLGIGLNNAKHRSNCGQPQISTIGLFL